ncbi:hypothetical protein O181_002674 [Austropuccinia psidii MF-1]|uniref:Uncharacterized protein n=1 Tax=Austropuccinia psidii MF-1 TaxID=1389203 RepID=A0A9Q3BCQ0_9BASI|nr:hypothetical protein [Austropuccinia psidii MF-1]
MFSEKSEEPLLYEKIWNFPLSQNHMSIPWGLPKILHALYLLVHNLVQPIKHKKQKFENILFEEIVLYMDYQNPMATLNIPNSTSSDSLSVVISAMQYLGSVLSVNKVPIAPHHNESQEGTSITSKGTLTPTFMVLVDNIFQLMIAFNWVQMHTKVDSKTTQQIQKEIGQAGTGSFASFGDNSRSDEGLKAMLQSD